jgi:hypothetical protein
MEDLSEAQMQSMKEICIVVDSHDHPLGEMSKDMWKKELAPPPNPTLHYPSPVLFCPGN